MFNEHLICGVWVVKVHPSTHEIGSLYGFCSISLSQTLISLFLLFFYLLEYKKMIKIFSLAGSSREVKQMSWNDPVRDSQFNQMFAPLKMRVGKNSTQIHHLLPISRVEDGTLIPVRPVWCQSGTFIQNMFAVKNHQKLKIVPYKWLALQRFLLRNELNPSKGWNLFQNYFLAFISVAMTFGQKIDISKINLRSISYEKGFHHFSCRVQRYADMRPHNSSGIHETSLSRKNTQVNREKRFL